MAAGQHIVLIYCYFTKCNYVQIKRTKQNWIGHTLHKEADAIEKTTLDWNPHWLRFLLTWLRCFLPWLRFFRAFSSVVRQMPGYNSLKTGHDPHSSTLVVICVVRLLFVLFYVLFVCKCVLPPGDNPIAVNKYIIFIEEVDWRERGKGQQRKK